MSRGSRRSVGEGLRSEGPGDSISWRAVAPAFATLVVAMLPGFLAAAMAVQIGADIGLTLAGLGMVVGVFFGSSALGSVLMGRLVERIGWANGLRMSALLAVPALGGTGLFAQSSFSMLPFFVLGGLSAALAQPATNLVVSECVPQARQGLLFGVKHVTVPLVTLLGGLAVPLVALTVGWRWSFYGGALVAGLSAVAVPISGDRHAAAPSARRASGGQRVPDNPLSLLVILAVGGGLGIAGMDALATFIVVYGVDVGLSESAAGMVLVAGSIASIAARLVAGWMVDRVQHGALMAVVVLLAVGAVGIAGVAIGTRPALLIGGLVGFTAGWGWSGLFSFAVVSDNPSAPAAASGVVHTGVFVGAALGPPGFGVLAESMSYRAAWSATAASLVVGAVLILYARSRRPEGAGASQTAPHGHPTSDGLPT